MTCYWFRYCKNNTSTSDYDEIQNKNDEIEARGKPTSNFNFEIGESIVEDRIYNEPTFGCIELEAPQTEVQSVTNIEIKVDV